MKLNPTGLIIGAIATLVSFMAEEGTKKALWAAHDKIKGTDDKLDEEYEMKIDEDED